MRSLGAALVLCTAVLVPAAPALAQTAQELLGREFPQFSLPSTAGRLASYERDHYGQHHLILTFFPAAFTPV